MSELSTPQVRQSVLARVGQVALSVAGAAVSLAGGFLVALLTLLWLPWRVDLGFAVVRVPLALVIAVAGVLVLVWYAPRATGSKWAVLLPAVSWFAVMAAAVSTTRQGGRLLMPNDLLAAVTLFVSTTTMVVAVVITLTAGVAGRRPGARDVYHR